MSVDEGLFRGPINKNMMQAMLDVVNFRDIKFENEDLFP